MAVVPVLQRFRPGVARQLAQEVLIARGLAWIEIAVVEARAFELDVAGLWIDLAAGDIGTESIDQAAGADDERIAVKAVLAVQSQRELAGQIQPQRHEFAFARRGVMLGEFGDDLLAEEELKEFGLGDVRGEFDVIEAALAKLIDHERLVVFEDDEVHGSTP